MAEPDPIRAFNRKYGQGLADEPEVMTVVLVSGEGGSIYRRVAAPNDVDRIVGKYNRTVRSMRIILSAIGAILNRKVSLEIGE